MSKRPGQIVVTELPMNYTPEERAALDAARARRGLAPEEPLVVVRGVQPGPQPTITTDTAGNVNSIDFSKGGRIDSVTVKKGAVVTMKF